MKSNLLTANSLGNFSATTPRNNPIPFLFRPTSSSSNLSLSLTHQSSRSSLFVPICCSRPTKESKPIAEISSISNLEVGEGIGGEEPARNLTVQVGNPVVPLYFQSWTKLSLSDQAFLLLTFIACTVWLPLVVGFCLMFLVLICCKWIDFRC
uniref:Uncharacterized protein LOC105647794 isoform X2 n=1 Tax=Rhizophora mucronata TaxID=61149 RepID=A0A2P2JCX2_RHIMU